MAAIEHKLQRVANGRDLVAKVIEVAQAAQAAPREQHTLLLVGSKLSAEHAEAVFTRTLSVLEPGIAERIRLEIQPAQPGMSQVKSDVVRLPARPNIRFHLLRLLIEAKLRGAAFVTGRELSRALGVSEHPIREASKALEAVGMVATTREGRSLAIDPWECTPDLLARVDAKPLQVRYRFRAGAAALKPEALERRFESMWHQYDGWWALAGLFAARLQSHFVDLSGPPRVDLIVRVSPRQRYLDLSWLHEIAPRMEREPNPLELAPLVLTIVQERRPLESEDTYRAVASHADTMLTLLDQGLFKQARDFAADLETMQ
jgi:biotin operon repressor